MPVSTVSHAPVSGPWVSGPWVPTSSNGTGLGTMRYGGSELRSRTCGTVVWPVVSFTLASTSRAEARSASWYSTPFSFKAAFAFLQCGHPTVLTTPTVGAMSTLLGCWERTDVLVDLACTRREQRTVVGRTPNITAFIYQRRWLHEQYHTDTSTNKCGFHHMPIEMVATCLMSRCLHNSVSMDTHGHHMTRLRMLVVGSSQPPERSGAASVLLSDKA